MIKKLHGTVHGAAIELEENLDLSDGERVEVTVERLEAGGAGWGEGLRQCAGTLAHSWTNDDDRILEQIHRERQSDSRPEVP